MIATENVVPKLKIKFSTKSVKESLPRESLQQQLFSEKWDCSPMREQEKSGTGNKSLNSIGKFSGSRKRSLSVVSEGQNTKRQKLDRNIVQQCSAILRQLMNHPAGWIFNQPVDPVALNIPDYFDIISEPMDLGTIKTKISRNEYSRPEEFVSDIRLTFSNAMCYNPPTNNVHQMAKELLGIFERKWKLVTTKFNHENQRQEIHGTRQTCPKSSSLDSNLCGKAASSSEQIKRSLHVRAAKVDHPKVPLNCTNKFGKFSRKANKPQADSDASVCGRCCKLSCQCRLPSDLTSASLSDTSSERSSRQNCHPCNVEAFNSDSRATSTPASQINADHESDDDRENCPSSKTIAPTTDACSRECTSILDAPLSPSRALRAAKLKSRFADTILKAKQRTLHNHHDNADPVKLQLEKERLERAQLEEKARIEAEIKAAEVASLMKAEAELKRWREKEREAVRLELYKMEKTVDMEQNLEILKELEKLTGYSLCRYQKDSQGRCRVVSEAFSSFRFRSPLERLGLYLKDEYLADEDDDNPVLTGDWEEGEIAQ